MKTVLAVALGGALGAVARYRVNVISVHYFGADFPFGTLIVNVVGSFIMGVLVETMALVWAVSTETRAFLLVGILGAFTTFSAFSLDFAVLYERGKWTLSAVYVSASVILSVSALFAGLHVMRRLLPPAA